MRVTSALSYFRAANFRACVSFGGYATRGPPLIDGPIGAKVDYTTDGSRRGALQLGRRDGAGVKKTLQNKHGGYLIDHGTPMGGTRPAASR